MMVKKRAFTLVELLVVISIIALLLAILMPSLNKARQAGQRVVCANNMKTIGMANQIYVNSWNEKCVPVMDTSVPKPNTVNGSFTYYCWMANKSFRKYIELDGRKAKTYSAGSYELDTILPDEFYCPSDAVAKRQEVSSKGVLVSYGYNTTDWEEDLETFRWTRPTATKIYAGAKMTDIKRPASKLAFVDAVDWYVFWSGANYTKYWDKLGQVNPDVYNGIGVSGVTIYRHNDGANVLFYDSHVSYMKKDKVFVKRNPPVWPTSSAEKNDATGMWIVQ